MTSYYYSGNKLVAEREASTLRYFHQDSLSSTSLMTDSSGGSLGTVKFAPFGSARSGSVPTDIQFTGQRLDATDLYYYGARFYDPAIGRFISPDTLVQSPTNPQNCNRYSYVMNNPLKYTDPTGHYWTWDDETLVDVWVPDDPPSAATPPLTPSLPLVTNQPVVPQGPEPDLPPAPITMGPEPTAPTSLKVADVVAVVADIAAFIPPVTVLAIAVGIGSSAIGLTITRADYSRGLASKRDLDVAEANFWWSLIPWVGIIPSYNQMAYDLKWLNIWGRR